MTVVAKDSGLAGRRAVVTGATSGMGAAIARRLAREGARVAMLGRRQQRLDGLVAELGDQHLGLVCDVADIDAVNDAVAVAANRFGGLDLVVTNAGGALLGSIAEGDPHNWKSFIDVNFTGALSCVHSALSHMESPADVVMIGSTSADRPSSFTAVYAGAKAGVQRAAEGLRQELAPKGIRVTLVEPGRVDTEVSEHAIAEPGAVRGSMGSAFTPLAADDIAEVVAVTAGLPVNVCIGRIVVRPVGQIEP
ncbi:SDR family oxidoreductase [[Mycobacterium] vasticus]|uniref:SDR family oxidoreductase n=1 Tax=[Mycobacterium] vasticus TaxID=2875777 RepID=A0ABU5Z6A2_9MYCO|nr:SDR family oxidoreductase [Mycolicibacter sp. MYC017]MEB3071473.1 SDR family oxidoreductase [Mycolicibacter sp. MYC017]